MTPGNLGRCDCHDFTLPVCRGRRGNGNFIDYYECNACDAVVYVESDRVTGKIVLTRNLDTDDWTKRVGVTR